MPQKDADMGLCLASLWLVGWLVSFVAALWAADLWTREVDTRCVGATKWMESVLSLKE